MRKIGHLIDKDLTVYWSMDNRHHDAENNIIRDASGDGNDGTIEGGPSFPTTGISAPVREGFDLTETGQQISIDASTFAGRQCKTISFWTRQTSTGAAWDSKVVVPVSNDAGNFLINSSQMGDLSRLYTRWVTDPAADGDSMDDGGAWSRSGTYTYRDGVWHHYASTFDGNTIREYWDGEIFTTSTGYNSSVASIRSGGEIRVESPHLWAIDEFRLYERALSPPEVRAIADYDGFSVEPVRKMSTDGSYTGGVTEWRYDGSRWLDSYFTDGLIGYWSFEGGGVHVTSDMATALDGSGYNSDGAISGNPTITGGILGDGFNCDGTNDYVEVGAGGDHPYTNAGEQNINDSPFAYSLWVNTTQSGSWRGLIGLGGSQDCLGAIMTDTGELAIAIASGGTSAEIASSRTINDGVWHHIVAQVAADGTITGFVDADKVIDDPGIGITPTNKYNPPSFPWWRGAARDVNPLDGVIDEVRIFKGTLTGAQIFSLYSQVNPL